MHITELLTIFRDYVIIVLRGLSSVLRCHQVKKKKFPVVKVFHQAGAYVCQWEETKWIGRRRLNFLCYPLLTRSESRQGFSKLSNSCTGENFLNRIVSQLFHPHSQVAPQIGMQLWRLSISQGSSRNGKRCNASVYPQKPQQ